MTENEDSREADGARRSEAAAVSSVPGGNLPGGPAEDAREERAQADLAVKIASFAADRRALVHRIAKTLGMAPPPGVDEFFAAVAASRWEEVDARLASFLRQTKEAEASDALRSALAPVFETYCVVDAVQSRPAEQFFEYGHGLMQAAGPANAYVCNNVTDYGILSLLNATAGSGQKIVISPIFLTDPTYTAYLQLLYPGKMAYLSAQDISRARESCTMGADPADEAAESVTNTSEKVPQELVRTLANMNPQLSFARHIGLPGSPRI